MGPAQDKTILKSLKEGKIRNILLKKLVEANSKTGSKETFGKNSAKQTHRKNSSKNSWKKIGQTIAKFHHYQI